MDFSCSHPPESVICFDFARFRLDFLRWLQKIRARVRGAPTELTCSRTNPVQGTTVPVIPGVLPIQTNAALVRVTKLCGTYIPDAIQADLEPTQVSLIYCTTFFKSYSLALALS